MGSIRLVMLEGLNVGDLLVLRAGGFFDGKGAPLPVPVAERVEPQPVPMPEGAAAVAAVPTLQDRPADVVVTAAGTAEVRAAPPQQAPQSTQAERFPPLPPDQQALLEQFKIEAAEYRAEKGIPADDGEPSPDAVVAPPRAAGVAQLANCTKLRDVLQLLLDGGMRPEDLPAYLESVRGQVPLLQRISNIEERVARTLSVMGVVG